MERKVPLRTDSATRRMELTLPSGGRRHVDATVTDTEAVRLANPAQPVAEQNQLMSAPDAFSFTLCRATLRFTLLMKMLR